MLNFESINDEQLLQLIQAALKEAIERGGTIAAAARTEFVDAATRAQIEAEALAKAQAKAAERERERIEQEAKRKAEAQIKAQEEQQYATKQALLWGQQKAIHLALQEWGVNEDHKINVWERGGDKRIYFEQDIARSGWKVTYYITGNNWHAPGEFGYESLRGAQDERIKNLAENESDQEALIRLFDEIASRWKSLNSSSDKALMSRSEPLQNHLSAYREALLLTAKVTEVGNV